MTKSNQFGQAAFQAKARARSQMTKHFEPRRGLLGLLLLLAAQAALADVSIVNLVFSDSNSVRSVVCYNGHGSQGPDGLNCNPPGFVVESNPYVTVIGNMDTTGLATAASENLMLNSPTGESAAAYALGDLSTGILRSRSSGSSGAEGVTAVSISDTVHFAVAGANINTVTPIDVTWTFDGALTGPFLGFSGTPVEAQSTLQFGGFVGASEDIFGGPPQLTAIGQSGWASYNFTSATPSLVQFTGVYDLVGPSVTLPFSLAMETFASNGDTADFSHTSQVGLILPSSVTYASSSGAFLTASQAAVPEPGSLSLLGLALALTAALSRQTVRKRLRVS